MFQVTHDSIQGELRLEGVGFTYQMRPDKQVLAGRSPLVHSTCPVPTQHTNEGLSLARTETDVELRNSKLTHTHRDTHAHAHAHTQRDTHTYTPSLDLLPGIVSWVHWRFLWLRPDRSHPALTGVDLVIPPRTVCALVGRRSVRERVFVSACSCVSGARCERLIGMSCFMSEC